MLWARLHRRALHGVQLLSTLRRNQNAALASEFLDAPTITSSGSTCPSSKSSHHEEEWSSSSADSTRLVCMSDTHGHHNDIPYLPHGDVLIHAGDFTKYGETQAVEDLSRYFLRQKETYHFQNVVCCAGNHDLTFHEDYYEQTWSRHIRSADPSEAREALKHCTYLEDSSTLLQPERTSSKSNGNMVVHGSPWTPEFFKWAFNLPRGEALREVWSKIPDSCDILVTHGPPHGRGDITLHSGHFGCQDLKEEIQQRVKPRVHVYGHIHEGYGTSFDGHTLYVNASSLDLGYEANNPSIVIDVPHDKTQPAMVVQPNCWVHDTEELICWLKQNRYFHIADKMEMFHASQKNDNNNSLPMGNDLFAKSAFQTLCDKLLLHRRKNILAKQDLRTALCQLYAESFL